MKTTNDIAARILTTAQNVLTAHLTAANCTPAEPVELKADPSAAALLVYTDGPTADRAVAFLNDFGVHEVSMLAPDEIDPDHWLVRFKFEA